MFGRCFAEKPLSVHATATGSSNHSDRFSTHLVTLSSWGFEMDVIRTDTEGGWNQSSVYANWIAVFSKIIYAFGLSRFLIDVSCFLVLFT